MTTTPAATRAAFSTFEESTAEDWAIITPQLERDPEPGRRPRPRAARLPAQRPRRLPGGPAGALAADRHPGRSATAGTTSTCSAP